MLVADHSPLFPDMGQRLFKASDTGTMVPFEQALPHCSPKSRIAILESHVYGPLTRTTLESTG